MYLEEDSEVDDNDTTGDEHVLCWYEVRDGNDETVGNCSTETSVCHDELVDLQQNVIFRFRISSRSSLWCTC